MKTLEEYKAEKFEQLATKMTDETTFSFVTSIVEVYMDFEMEGKEKLAEVVKIVKPVIISIVPFFTEMVVQIVYYYVKSKMATTATK